jgi:hypothetical protein
MKARTILAVSGCYLFERQIGETYLKKGKPVLVLARWNGKGPRNVLIERADGSRVVRPFRGLRKPTRGDWIRLAKRL